MSSISERARKAKSLLAGQFCSNCGNTKVNLMSNHVYCTLRPNKKNKFPFQYDCVPRDYACDKWKEDTREADAHM